jgi:hypothetical protein
VALVLPKDAVVALFSSPHMAARPQDTHRATENIDGAVVTALTQAGFTEYVHTPSLVQHTGVKSLMGHAYGRDANSFLGEAYDASQLSARPAFQGGA